jgi:hypothetical protein
MTSSKSNQSTCHKLHDTWNLYYHLPNNTNWELSSYIPVIENINYAEQILLLNEKLNDVVIKNCMFFLMRTNITPTWEDKANRNGGCFSYKVMNKYIHDIWKRLFFLACGESIFKQKEYNDNVNGITISPKKQFCIVKIWMKTTEYQDPTVVTHIPNLITNGCLFKAHEPEY